MLKRIIEGREREREKEWKFLVRLCETCVRGHWCKIIVPKKHVPTGDKINVFKESFCNELK